MSSGSPSQAHSESSVVGTTTCFELLETELRREAEIKLSREQACISITASDLLQDCYLRLVASGANHWGSRESFRAAASVTMRRILVDRARRRLSEKRGGGRRPRSLDDLDVTAPVESPRLVDLDDALRRLETAQPELGRFVELRFFGGLTIEQVAVELGMSTATAKRRWRLARAWLLNELGGEP